ncbi:MAG: aminomethyl-transferring glycine dehydrogenase subunit GcvPB, partial [Alcanivorax sp.]
MSNETTLIFQHSRPGRSATAQAPKPVSEDQLSAIPASLRRKHKPGLPEVGELEVVRHYTNLSTKNFAIDKQFYPLGSCTMKYNPRGANRAAMLPGFLNRHPLAPASHSQGYLACL